MTTNTNPRAHPGSPSGEQTAITNEQQSSSGVKSPSSDDQQIPPTSESTRPPPPPHSSKRPQPPSSTDNQPQPQPQPSADPAASVPPNPADPAEETGASGEVPKDDVHAEKQQSANATPERGWKFLGELEKEKLDSDTELIRRRYFCVSGGLLLVGPSGIGKSSLIIQLTTAFALGLPSLGFEPVRPLKILIIQAENDESDLADMRDGVFAGLNLTPQQKHEAGQSIVVVTEDSLRGADLCNDRLKPLLQEHHPDLLVIDPALAYINGDSISGRDVGLFLRSQINPLVREYKCGVIIVHHTNKPGRESKPENLGFDPAYLGSGSAEWTNWPRAILYLQKLKDGGFDLHAAKRGIRLNWKNDSGEKVLVKRLTHCKTGDRICWEEVPESEVQRQSTASKECNAKPGKSALLKLVPENGTISKTALQESAHEAGISRDRFKGFLAQLIQERLLRESKVPRKGAKAETCYERVSTTSDATA